MQEYEMIRNSKFSRHRGVDDVSARTSCSVVYTATEEIPLNPLRVDVTVQLPNPVVETVQRKDERVEHLCAVARLWGNILYQCTACQDSKACQLLHIIVALHGMCIMFHWFFLPNVMTVLPLFLFRAQPPALAGDGNESQCHPQRFDGAQ